MADEQLLIPGINDKELGKLSPPAGATAMPPLEETTIEEDDKLYLPGKVKLRQDYDGISEERLRNQKLCGNLLQYVASRELHVLVDQTTSTKDKWKKAWEQAHDHTKHPNEWPKLGVITSTPFEPYRRLVKGDSKMRTLVKDTATYFADLYDKDEAAATGNGSAFLPDIRRELGKKIISERDTAVKEKKQKSSAKTAAKEKEAAENEAAEDHLGLVPNRGVSAPSGTVLTDDVREGLAALGGRTLSHTARPDINPRRPKTNSVIDIDGGEDDDGDVLMTSSPRTPQPQKKAPTKKKRKGSKGFNKDINQSMSDAEKAASDSVDIMKDSTSTKAKKQRAILRNEDAVGGLDDLTKQLASNGKSTASLANCLEKVLTQSSSKYVNSPSTKHMEKISLYQDHLSKLREQKKSLIADGADDDEIAEVEAEIGQYKQMKKNLNEKLLAAANAEK